MFSSCPFSAEICLEPICWLLSYRGKSCATLAKPKCNRLRPLLPRNFAQQKLRTDPLHPHQSSQFKYICAQRSPGAKICVIVIRKAKKSPPPHHPSVRLSAHLTGSPFPAFRFHFFRRSAAADLTPLFIPPPPPIRSDPIMMIWMATMVRGG